jgi:SAM-dependent methyltransferase
VGLRRARPPGWTHALSYQGRSVRAVVHRSRVRLVGEILDSLDLPDHGLLLDFGCSDGYVLSLLRDRDDLAGWRLVGYDRAAPLVAAARDRSVPAADFHRLDLDHPAAAAHDPGDVVLCLETLEHVGRYECALAALHRSARPGAWIVISMPNEVGALGLAKLMLRPMVRTNVYRGFFARRRDIVRYAGLVVIGGDIAAFRDPPRSGWGPHLGFDRRRVREYVQSEYVEPGRWAVVREEWTLLHTARLSVFRRSGERPAERASPR